MFCRAWAAKESWKHFATSSQSLFRLVVVPNHYLEWTRIRFRRRHEIRPARTSFGSRPFQEPPPPWFPTTLFEVHFTNQEASLDTLLLESFKSDTLYFQWLYEDNEIVKLRVRGQNSKRVVDREAIVRDLLPREK
jgi:hypothetical protein